MYRLRHILRQVSKKEASFLWTTTGSHTPAFFSTASSTCDNLNKNVWWHPAHQLLPDFQASGRALFHHQFRGTSLSSQGHVSSYKSSTFAIEELSTSGAPEEEHIDPFAVVADELALLAQRMRAMVVSEIPKLAAAAEYFFKLGAEGKKFRPTVLLLMATSIQGGADMAGEALEGVRAVVRQRQQRIAEITEMIHVASLLHDDVLDHSDTRRGIGSLNYVMGNKLAVLAGDFLLARSSVALASLRNTEVVELLSKVLEHLVAGEIMQMTASSEQCNSMEYYMEKNFNKTASLIANSCKAVAVLGGGSPDVANAAFDYGRHLGLAYQLVDDALDFTGTTASLGKPALSDLRQGLATAPVLLAAEEFPALSDLIARKFKRSGDVEQALAYVQASNGVERTRQMAAQHALEAANAVSRLPTPCSEHTALCRRALVDLTRRVLQRSK